MTHDPGSAARTVADLFNRLHDGTLTDVRRDGERTHSLRIDIEYLAEMFEPGAEAFWVRLEGCAGVAFQPYADSDADANAPQELSARSELDVTLLSATHDAEQVLIGCAEGQLALRCTSAQITLDTGAPIATHEFNRAVEIYWDRWERRNAGARAGLRLELATERDLSQVQDIYAKHIAFLEKMNPTVEVDRPLDRQWIEKPGVLFAWKLVVPSATTTAKAQDSCIGIALVGARKLCDAMNVDADFMLCEFHVLPDARRQGLGAAALTQLFEQHPGTWSLVVLPANTIAIAFWNRTLAPYMSSGAERIDDEGVAFQRYQFSTSAWLRDA